MLAFNRYNQSTSVIYLACLKGDGSHGVHNIPPLKHLRIKRELEAKEATIIVRETPSRPDIPTQYYRYTSKAIKVMERLADPSTETNYYRIGTSRACNIGPRGHLRWWHRRLPFMPR